MPWFLTGRLTTLRSLTSSRNNRKHVRRLMVTLVVATTVDPASIGPASALLSMPDRHPGPFLQVTLEATHHGPITDSPTMFVEIGSTEEYWKRQDAAQAIALVRMKHRLVWKGLGLDGGIPVGDWRRNNGKKKILLGVGGGHYVPRHMDIVL
ncbi:hypothetical protein L1987_80247 [Smallanthus sonchifolius]|uniref:Uncharacterized protein n=2 Tax=Smallanthus sonchifolius TaxID=185202 RepID=A0ACB8YNC3_9ASTR|nr:hypothetical protein L1987_80244 [Smallanthus sonchifolius]KAI3686568.1 hypothetical protein L1987_80247 [Smallanthus sonchifolius]